MIYYGLPELIEIMDNYFENDDYYWNSSLYSQDNVAVDQYQTGFMAQQP